jgi:hypothetical protein
MYSRTLPCEEEQQLLIKEYDDRFEMGDLLRNSFTSGKWGKFNAKKMTAKIILNSGWGKHAQRPHFDKTILVDHQNTDLHAMYQNIDDDNLRIKQIHTYSAFNSKVVTETNTRKVLSNQHDGYLPAAVYVPAYGRVQLWKQLNLLGKRALYHDTDSIIYLYDPEQYNIPEGDILGDWEVEDIDKDNDGIKEFVAAGPKTYAFKTVANNVTVAKCKGISLAHAHQNLFNFKVLKDNVLVGLDMRPEKISVPQFNFVSVPGRGTFTSKDFKQFGFDPETQKGFIHGKYQYPLGFNKDLL